MLEGNAISLRLAIFATFSALVSSSQRQPYRIAIEIGTPALLGGGFPKGIRVRTGGRKIPDMDFLESCSLTKRLDFSTNAIWHVLWTSDKRTRL